MLAAAYAYSTYFRFSIDDTAYLTPVPWETVKKYSYKDSIHSKFEAVIAAQLQLGTSRLRPVDTPKVIYVERLDYMRAKGTVIPLDISGLDAFVSDNGVWFVVFEGQWSMEGGPAEPEPTWTSTDQPTILFTPTPSTTSEPSPAPHGCVYVMIYGSSFGDGSAIGGIKNCAQWKANQNIGSYFDLDGTHWILQSMHGKELLEGTTITLKFEGSEVTGSDGCNHYWKVLTPQPDDEIVFRITVQLCHEPESIMKQEDQYVSALKQWASYHIEGQNLFVMDEGGNILLQYKRLPELDSNPDD
jgi:heat shock protein HslJ